MADSTDSDDEGPEYLLGFLEKPEKPQRLLRHFFPSKVGGLPVGKMSSRLISIFQAIFENLFECKLGHAYMLWEEIFFAYMRV